MQSTCARPFEAIEDRNNLLRDTVFADNPALRSTKRRKVMVDSGIDMTAPSTRSPVHGTRNYDPDPSIGPPARKDKFSSHFVQAQRSHLRISNSHRRMIAQSNPNLGPRVANNAQNALRMQQQKQQQSATATTAAVAAVAALNQNPQDQAAEDALIRESDDNPLPSNMRSQLGQVFPGQNVSSLNTWRQLRELAISINDQRVSPTKIRAMQLQCVRRLQQQRAVMAANGDQLIQQPSQVGGQGMAQQNSQNPRPQLTSQDIMAARRPISTLGQMSDDQMRSLIQQQPSQAGSPDRAQPNNRSLQSLGPHPSQWTGQEETMRNWLQAKAEEDRRRQKEERALENETRPVPDFTTSRAAENTVSARKGRRIKVHQQHDKSSLYTGDMIHKSSANFQPPSINQAGRGDQREAWILNTNTNGKCGPKIRFDTLSQDRSSGESRLLLCALSKRSVSVDAVRGLNLAGSRN